MKKVASIILTMLFVFMFWTNTVTVKATQQNVIDNETESKIVEIKETETKNLADYQEKYGSKVYGTVAYILHLVQIYSIPFCFLGLAIGAIHKYIIGIRKLDTLEKVWD